MMNLKRKSLLLCVLALFCTVNLWGQVPQEFTDLMSIPVNTWKGSAQDQIIGAVVCENVTNLHYMARERGNEVFSGAWQLQYIKYLDASKMFFLQSEVDELCNETRIWNPKARQLNMIFPFKVFQKYIEKNREFALFAADYIYSDIDFTADESYNIDLRNVQFCETREELQTRWRQIIKNALLSRILGDDDLEDMTYEDEDEDEDESKGKNESEDVPGSDNKNGEVAANTDGSGESKSEEPTKPELSPEEQLAQAKEKLLISYAKSYKARNQFTAEEIMELYLNAMCELFDPHTQYMAPETSEDFIIDTSLSLQGIGATLGMRDNLVTILEIRPGSPAEHCGELNVGDHIVGVAQDEDGEMVDIRDMRLSKAVHLIRGPKGSTVRLLILPRGSAQEKEISIVRDVINLDEAAAKLEMYTHKAVNGNEIKLAVIDLPSFYSSYGNNTGGAEHTSCSQDVRNCLLEARVKGAEGIILDLRNNGGGSLKEAVDICGLFAKSDVMVRTRASNVNFANPLGNSEKYEGIDGQLPLIILVNEFSASASEIVAAAMQDLHRGIVVGSRTHGKGSVQVVFSIDQDPLIRKLYTYLNHPGGTVKITVQKFYRINGEATQEKGVTPDICFPTFLQFMETDESSYPSCMPWDKLPEQDKYTLSQYCKNGNKILEDMKQAQEKYMAENPLYAEYLRQLEFFKAYNDQKEIPLNIDKRKEYLKTSKECNEQFLRFRAKQNNESDIFRQRRKKKNTDNHDIILEATLEILGEVLANEQEAVPESKKSSEETPVVVDDAA